MGALETIRTWALRRLAGPAVAPKREPRFRAGFAGAQTGRLAFSLQQSSQSVNSDLDGALTILRSRARGLTANNEFGRRFLSLVSNNIVGPCGPKLQVRALLSNGTTLDKAANDAVEMAFAKWSRRADVTGRMSLARLLCVLVEGVARDGEALVRVVRGKNLPHGVALQLLEPDRLDESFNARLTNGNIIRQGVELDSAMRPVAYHVFSSHPGEAYAGMTTRDRERVPARDMYHVFLPRRAEQVRGYTWLHAVLMRANMLAGFEEAAIVAARVGAAKMGVFTRKPEAADAIDTLGDAKDAAGALQVSAEAGEFFELPPGYELSSWDPEYPHQNFESFVKQCVRGLAAGLDVATHNLSGDMTDVNYSSARIAELAERDVWQALQEWLIDSFLYPFYATDWLPSALLRGEIALQPSGKALPYDRVTKFADASRFQGRRWGWVDPLKEAQAAQALIDARLASRTEITAAQGREWDDVVAELGQEQDAIETEGLQPAPPPPAPQDPPEKDD